MFKSNASSCSSISLENSVFNENLEETSIHSRDFRISQPYFPMLAS